MKVLDKLKNGLIVSCQSEGDDPFNTPEGMALFARAAEMGGAAGIRSEGIAKTKEILRHVDVPVIGLVKDEFEDGSVCITRVMEAVDAMCEMGCEVIAVDGTDRKFHGMTGSEFIRQVKREFEITVMADLDRLEAAEACIKAGADCLSTTLSGYTAATRGIEMHLPDIGLLRALVKTSKLPVFAEGRINTPELAKTMIEAGAWAVVVGTAITRPRVVTGWYLEAMSGKR